jgi:predicted ABC-type ATPase
MHKSPTVILIGGPNGAGKTTISRQVISETLGVAEFVNADTIAQGLSGFDPERAAMQAGRIMLHRVRELASARANFAFESTLASRTFAPWIADLVKTGYEFNLVFVWLRSPELAIQRMKLRVRKGGHFVPPDTIRRRYQRGIANFVNMYMPTATRWVVYDNSATAHPVLVAHRDADSRPVITIAKSWARILEIASEQTPEDDR